MSKKKNTYDTNQKSYQYSDFNNQINNNIDFDNMSEDDKYSMQLLSLQYIGNFISIFSEGIFLNATLQGINIVLERNMVNNNFRDNDNINNVDNIENSINNPDILGLQCTYGFFIAKIIFSYVAFERYKVLVRQKAEGKIKYSIQPNIYLNIANVLGILSSCYTLNAAQQIVSRNRNQPIFGI